MQSSLVVKWGRVSPDKIAAVAALPCGGVVWRVGGSARVSDGSVQ